MYNHQEKMIEKCIERINYICPENVDEFCLEFILAYEQALIDTGKLEKFSSLTVTVSLRGFEEIRDKFRKLF